MPEQRVKIVLDADVIIHFAKGGRLSMLPKILPEFQFLVLDVVKREIPVLLQAELNLLLSREKSIVEEQFGGTAGERREFARLTATGGLALGKGESACMVYCRYHHDVLASSNLKDICDYCDSYGIVYLTTIDFLFYAIQRGLMTKEEAESFISKVVGMGSRLPSTDFETYTCHKL